MRGIRVMNSSSRRDPRETLDVFIGIVGFFTAAFFVITLVCEVTGQDALGWALTLLAFVVLLALLLLGRRRMTRRMLAARQRLRPQSGPAQQSDGRG